MRLVVSLSCGKLNRCFNINGVDSGKWALRVALVILIKNGELGVLERIEKGVVLFL